MTAVLVDSNVLLDVMTDDPRWGAWSRETLARTADRRRLVINPIIYAEISTHFSRIEALEEALPAHLLQREPVPFEAAFLAGKLFLEYRRRGGRKQAPLPDFFIGAHAAVSGYLLLTRDARGYRTSLPKLRLIAPPGNGPDAA